MRSALTRSLQAILRPSAEGEAVLEGITPEGDVERPDDFDWLDYTIFLLHVAAEIEHSLMVQYLYAAYSLGGDDLSDQDRENARVWREIILGIAKEEMAHLLTVQNILRALGGPLHLEREDYPYRSEFYPFHFKLERLTKNSLAKYVYAEAPEDWEGTEADEIKARANQGEEVGVNRVGRLYSALIRHFRDGTRIRDDQFLAATVPYQASWDEWGRGYRSGERGDQSGRNRQETPDLFVDVVRDRASAIVALENIAQQGEAPVTANQPKSHFIRFLEIYRAIDETNPPSRRVPTSPTTNAIDANGRTVISHPTSIRWCLLFDLRYRMLLFRLKHAFFDRARTSTTTPTERGNLISWTFGEMYNLRAIAGIIMQLPLTDPETPLRAAPPFEMPYSISLPDWDSDKWRMHQNLIADSRRLTAAMRADDDPQNDYLLSLENSDALAAQIIEALIARTLQEERA